MCYLTGKQGLLPIGLRRAVREPSHRIENRHPEATRIALRPRRPDSASRPPGGSNPPAGGSMP